VRNRDKKIDLLRELPLFAGVRRREVRQLAAATDFVNADAGRVLCRADRRALGTYIVVDGVVDVVMQGTTIASLGRGQIVGELGAIDGAPRSADVVAATDVTLLEIHASALRGLIETSHALRTALLGQLVRNVDLEVALRPAV
jgi:CRP/FNR family transcriptional regulator, cyclic AMP receptor protein